ncbi:hypothetical protein ACFO1B_24565 [Dactylosporangium siamense]|uniref:Uncharacterized protein n=1 Tax=Dactylosporangium siamense TaxID=685454 RepID=A0A919PSC2_9ACTN|nr:hypothetical protein [Dactylosporangium siamense]GIG47528.1 hypothetical protein Dsi01nite_055690 [Dactylosporangium siamense]
MNVAKSKILEVLRSRGQNDRADWVDRTMPDEIDTAKNSGLLSLLKLDAADLTDEPDRQAG